jgi:DNA-binding PadR family transcriptional regulator
MTLGAVLLGVLSAGPAHGYDLKRAYDDRFPGSRPLAYGPVYAALGRLQRDGFVEVVTTERDAGPERTVYALTEGGAEELRAWLATVEPPTQPSADELVRKTVTALHVGSDAEGFLTRQREAHMQVLRELTRARAAAPSLGTRIALDHTIVHVDADLRWLEQSRQRVAAAREGPPPASDPTRPADPTEEPHR